MHMRSLLLMGMAVLVLSAFSSVAKADAKGVGLGVGAGVNVYGAEDVDTDAQPSWGFFVDIPLLDTFYITPSTMIYQLDVGEKISVTDVDLNFKFIVPVAMLRFGLGFSAGITTGIGDYRGHYGGLGYLGWNMVSNLDAFVLAQFKRFNAETGGEDQNFNNTHLTGGVMFRF